MAPGTRFGKRWTLHAEVRTLEGMPGYIAADDPAAGRGRRRSCGGGCLRSVLLLAAVIVLLVVLGPLNRSIAARLRAPDYATGILTESGGLALNFLAGFVLTALMGMVALRKKQPGFAAVVGLLGVVCLVLAAWTGYRTALDIAGTPATVRGTITYRFVDSHKGGSTRYVRVNGIDYTATPGVYRQTVEGRCAVLTYGPVTRVATAVHACPQ